MKIFWFALCIVACSVCSVVHAESVDDLIRQGDVYDRKLLPAEALRHYHAAEKLSPPHAGLLVRIARQYRHLMADTPNRDEKLRLGGIALDYSRRAAALGPKDSDAQIAIGITYGKMLALQGGKEQVEASRHIKNSADAAIKANPQNDTAWHVLGRWHKVLANVGAVKRSLGSMLYGKLPSTTNETAVSCFEKAIKINGNRLMHHIELGLTYMQMGRNDDARRALTKGLALPDVEKDDPELRRRGREALAKLR